MADRAKQPSPSRLAVLAGGKRPLTTQQRVAVSEMTDVIRSVPPEQIEVLLGLVKEVQRENYLEKIRPYDLPVIKVLAEVISARSFQASTLKPPRGQPGARPLPALEPFRNKGKKK